MYKVSPFEAVPHRDVRIVVQRPQDAERTVDLPLPPREFALLRPGARHLTQLLLREGNGRLDGSLRLRAGGLRNILLHGGSLGFNFQLLRPCGAYPLIAAAGMLEECNCQLLQCDSPHGHGKTRSKYFTGGGSLAYEAEPKRLQNGLMLVDAAKFVRGVVDV